MLPPEGRDVGEQLRGGVDAGLFAGQDRLAQLQRVPVNDDSGEQVEAGDTVPLDAHRPRRDPSFVVDDVAPTELEDEFAWLAGVYQANGRLLSPNSLPRRDVTARDRWRADPLELSG